MRHILALMLISIILSAGCIAKPEPEEQSPINIDLQPTSLLLSNTSPLYLGSPIPLNLTVVSAPNASYRAAFRINGKQVKEQVFSGGISNSTVKTTIPAIYDGSANISVLISPANPKQYIDNNAVNNMISLDAFIPPYTTTAPIVPVANNTNIYEGRSYAAKLYFDNSVYVRTIGAFIRKTAALDSNSTLVLSLHPDLNGSPSNETVMDFSIPLLKLSFDWRLILLQSSRQKLEKGNYWLEFSINKKGFAEVGCEEGNETSNSLAGTKTRNKTAWSSKSCTPFVIVSSNDPASAFSEYSNLSIS